MHVCAREVTKVIHMFLGKLAYQPIDPRGVFPRVVSLTSSALLSSDGRTQSASPGMNLRLSESASVLVRPGILDPVFH